MPSFGGIPPHVTILHVIEDICSGRESLRGDVVSKMIEEFNGK